MKLILALFVGIALLVGCGDDRKTPDETSEESSPAEDVAVGGDDLDDPKVLAKITEQALPLVELQERGPKGEELLYPPNSQIPYTGWTKRVHDNGKVEMLSHYKDGKIEGPETRWHDNGQMSLKITYKNGRLEGLWTTWDENGKKIREWHFKDGVRVKE
jgi:hypothetical protein